MIMIRALKVTNFGNGLYGIEVPEKPITEEQSKVLNQLFPRLREEAHKLMDQEAMLDLVVNETPPYAEEFSEVTPTPKPYKAPKSPGY